jgi:hypothetical protein
MVGESQVTQLEKGSLAAKVIPPLALVEGRNIKLASY